MFEVAIGLSIFIGFAFNSFLALLSGGLVSAGYLALYIENHLRIAITLGLSLIVYLLVLFIKRYAIIFGRRRFALSMLLSIILSASIEIMLSSYSFSSIDLRIIGYIIPGLIANDIEKQGILKTFAAILLISLVIWLILHLGVFIR